MLHYYNVHLEYYLDGKKLIRTFYRCLIDENKKEEIISINWNNFKDFCIKYWGALPFHWETCRKGLRIDFIPVKKVIKEWKTPNLNMTVKIIYEESDEFTSIKKILEYYNGEKAIQYLTERGISIAQTVY